MYKKTIAYALVYMSYHGIYVAIDFYDDSSPNRSYPILQSSNGDTIFFNMNDTSARSSNNDTDASCVFGHSNTTDQFNQSTNLNEARGDVVTAMKNLSLKNIENLGKNYGWIL